MTASSAVYAISIVVALIAYVYMLIGGQLTGGETIFYGALVIAGIEQL